MIIGISMGQETSRILGQVSHNFLYWKKTTWRMYVVRGEINERTVYIQVRSFLARTLEVNGKARQAEGEQYLFAKHFSCLMGKLHTKGALEKHHFISAKDQSRIHQFGKKVFPGLFLGYALYAGEIWKGGKLVADTLRSWKRCTLQKSSLKDSM